MLCQSLGIEGWSRLKVVELRALKRPLAQALALPACCRLVILAWWRCSVTMISAPCRFISTSKLALSQPGRRGHRVNSAATLFSAVYRD